MADDLAPRVKWELARLASLELLRDGEILCEVEDVLFEDRSGALFVTDLRLLFLRTGVVRRRTKVFEILLEEVDEAEVVPDSLGKRKWSTLAISRQADESEPKVAFEGIKGGEARAAEIAGTVLRQRDLLRQSPDAGAR